MSVPISDETIDRTFRNRPAICHLLCTSERNERLIQKTFSSFCVRECARSKRTGEGFSSSEIKEVKHSGRRLRRNTAEQEEKACRNPEYEDGFGASTPSEILVDYEKQKPNLTVNWSPTSHKRYTNWSSYALLYHDDSVKTERCFLIPKDQHEWVIRNGDDWNYPNKIYLGVVTYPYDKVTLHSYAPRPPAPPTPTPTNYPGGRDKIIAASVGVAAGLVLLFVLVLVYRMRINLWAACMQDRTRRTDFETSMINNSCCVEGMEENGNVQVCPKINNDLKLSGPEFFYACYYPESQTFQYQVAAVVNYFRQNGYRVVMDVMSCNELVNLGPTRWAEQQIKKACKILVFLSPGLVRLCGTGDEDSQCSNQEHERIWYELSLLRTIYSQTHSAAKMVCITLPDKHTIDPRDVPLWAEMRYRWPEDKRKILNRLNDRPFIQPW